MDISRKIARYGDNTRGNEDITSEFDFLSSNGVSRIHGMMWKPVGKIRGILQISHGMKEHIERYDEFARYLADRGYLVVGNSHIGHGKSVGDSDEFGYFGEFENGSKKDGSYCVVKDLYHVTKIMKKHFPGIPYVLLGHSMGSFMARRYLMEYGSELNGIIIMGTGNQNRISVLAGKAIAKGMSAIKGEKYKSSLIEKLMFGNYNRKIDEPESKNSWLSSDGEMVKKFDDDDICGKMFTLNGIDTLMTTLEYIEKPANIRRIPTNVPMLILSGMDDPVGNYGRDVKKVYDIYKKHKVEKIALKLYEGCRHELLNEKIREEIYEDIYLWLGDNT